ncbi:hypothetical protein D3C72_1290770 [compost metagenome]
MGEQLAAQRAAGVRAGEIFGAEAARVEQGHGQRVAHGDLRGGARGGREVQRAGFLGDAGVDHDVGMARQRGVGAAGHGDQGHALALDHRQQHGEFVDLAAVGDGEHEVDRLDHAEVAVAGLGRVHEHRGRAGGGEGGGDLAADVAALAHAHHDHAAAHFEDLAHGLDETRADAGLQAEDGFGFDVECDACPGQDGFGVDHGGRGGAGAHRRILRGGRGRRSHGPGKSGARTLL